MGGVIGGGASPLLVMKGITKQFPGVHALSDVDLELNSGEVVALIGENGAGKSTLMNVLGGVCIPDAGKVIVNGRELRPGSVQDPLTAGVAIIHQELNLAGNLDIASNILLGYEPTAGFSRVDRKSLYKKAEQFARMVGIDVPLTTIVETLPTAQQQLVEIARALSKSSRIVVFDEPTSSLSDKEANLLFEVMAELRSRGVAMIYISHRLHEVEQVCDRAVVLRDGKNVGQLAKAELNRDSMVRLMVGRDVSRFFPDNSASASNEPVLSVKEFRYKGCRASFTFDALKGEVLGVAGLVGAGRTELARALFGVDPAIHGEIKVAGVPTTVKSPMDAVRSGIALVPEDRKELGLLLKMSVKENISLAGLPASKRLTLDPKNERQIAEEQVAALSIKTPGLDQAVENLSGGNQQKVALGKWLALKPKVLILDEPTRGIDVGSKSEIYKLIRKLADDGMAVIMISSEMEEIIGLSDRVLVLHEGAPQGILSRSELSEEKIMQLATGGGAL